MATLHSQREGSLELERLVFFSDAVFAGSGTPRMFRYVVRYDPALLWRNLLLLMWIAFLPFFPPPV